jgi:hypothetical protein
MITRTTGISMSSNIVAGRYLDVHASNPRAQALSPNFVAGRRLLRQVFLDPAERGLHADWDAATAGVRSERFRVLWARDARVAATDAEPAEDYALDAIDFAQAAIDEAGSAVLSAMYSRAGAIALSSSSG